MNAPTASLSPWRSPATRVWLLLVLATGLPWWLAAGHEVATRVAATAAVLLGGFKARLVFLHYMELQHAPWPWRWIFEGWALLCVSFILAGYWAA